MLFEMQDKEKIFAMASLEAFRLARFLSIQDTVEVLSTSSIINSVSTGLGFEVTRA
jgi:hypothetical protein